MFGKKKRLAALTAVAVAEAEHRVSGAQSAVAASERKLSEREQAVGCREDALEQRSAEVELLIANRVQAYEHLAVAWAEWEYVQAERIAFDLCYKPHPALKAAEQVAARGRLAAELRGQLVQVANAKRLYEYHYPWLTEFLDTEHEITYVDAHDYEEGKDDPARRQISKDEWEKLSTTERNQLALDRWLRSRYADAWQAGVDYERYIGYLREQASCTVTYYGEEQGYNDLGRDVIAEKDGVIEVIQCKRWGKRMGPIREKYVHQLAGTVRSLQMDNPDKTVVGTFTTTSSLSQMALDEAAKLGITVEEYVPMGHYPRIKCNVAADGERIYHLPFDQQYGTTVIEPHKGERLVTTVAEAEELGFRRAWKWKGAVPRG